mmetsp:Transcript_82712/g.213121  ORF Transcript_82712/g.213121 Transcript_82712/m.213121 type:complete len:158 (-) Transcript_82712:62-535(-)
MVAETLSDTVSEEDIIMNHAKQYIEIIGLSALFTVWPRLVGFGWIPTILWLFLGAAHTVLALLIDYGAKLPSWFGCFRGRTYFTPESHKWVDYLIGLVLVISPYVFAGRSGYGSYAWASQFIGCLLFVGPTVLAWMTDYERKWRAHRVASKQPLLQC